ncbi:hypothetical protein XELAEV_18007244mg [Xenopus laevis]|uniref:Ig-like domain-containing protein n=1 Tax=Xenopus laevis TaxID=8355 RepID=A0A974E174_XENLA|nr:hypothetical protein XELAEV_18007244mg [Xenopus laevis]
MAVSAGMNLTLPCRHESITPAGYIHWYRLQPGQGPQSVIIGFKDTVSGFQAMTFTKDRKSNVNRKEDLNQIPHSASAVEGSSFNNTCEYKTMLFGLEWYKQVPGEKFHFLRIQRMDEKMTEDRFVFWLQKEKQLSTLLIKHVEVSDSGTYWCALQAQY